MNNRIYSMNEDEQSRVASSLGKVSSDVENASSKMTSSLKNIEACGFLGSTLSNIRNQMEKTCTTGRNLKNKIQRYSEDLFQNETLLTQKIEELDVPQDFVKTTVGRYTSIYDIELSKKDSKSVNSGSDTLNKPDEIKDSSISKEVLTDISGKDTIKVDFNFDSETKKKEIYDLSKEDVEKKEYDDKSKIEKEQLRELNKEDTDEVDSTFNSKVEKEQLREFNKEDTDEVDSTFNSKVEEEQLREFNKEDTDEVNSMFNSTVEKEQLRGSNKEDTDKVYSMFNSKVEKEQLRESNKEDTDKVYSMFNSKVEKEQSFGLSGGKTEEKQYDFRAQINKSDIGQINGNSNGLGNIELNDSGFGARDSLSSINSNYKPADYNSNEQKTSVESYSTPSEEDNKKKKEKDAIQDFINNYSIINSFEQSQKQAKNSNGEDEDD